MSDKLKPMKRLFMFGKRELADPGEHMTPKEVMELYSRPYPSLTKGEIAGPFYEDEQEKYKVEGYTMSGSYGTKG